MNLGDRRQGDGCRRLSADIQANRPTDAILERFPLRIIQRLDELPAPCRRPQQTHVGWRIRRNWEAYPLLS